jgi:hypothetical protein
MKWSKIKMPISTTSESLTKDIGPNGAFILISGHVAFEPIARAFKMAVF